MARSVRGRSSAFVLASLTFFVSPITVAAQNCVAPPAGILAWWPLDETTGNVAADIAGNHPAVHLGGVTPSSGHVGGGLRFDGSTGLLSAADSDLWAFGSRDFTLEFWANFDSPAHGDVGHPGDVFIANDVGPFLQRKWLFGLYAEGLELIYLSTVGTAHFLRFGAFAPIVGQWYHISLTRSGSRFTVYVNAVPVGSVDEPADIADPPAPLTIGHAEEDWGFMGGGLDEMTIYSRALTSSEIQAIVNAAGGGKCKPAPPSGLSFFPSVGGDTGFVSIQISHNRSLTESVPVLSRASFQDIVGVVRSVAADGFILVATFDLRGKRRGDWDLVLTGPGGPVRATRPFTIEHGREQLWVDILGRASIRPDRPVSYYVTYGNRGNVDIDVANLLLTVPTTSSLRADAPTFGGPPSPLPRPFGGAEADAYLFTATDLAPADVRVLPVALTAGSATTSDISAYVYHVPSAPATMNGGPIATALTTDDGERITQIGFSFPKTRHPTDGGHTGFISADGRWVYDFGKTPGQTADSIARSRYDTRDWDVVFEIPFLSEGQAQALTEWAQELVRNGPLPVTYTHDPFLTKAIELGFGTCHGFVERGLEVANYDHGEGLVPARVEDHMLPWWRELSPELLYNNLRNLRGNQDPKWSDKGPRQTIADILSGLPTGGLADIANRLRAFVSGEANKRVAIVTSVDPNDKIGSDGSGIERFIASSEPLRYTIFFENLATATAPAQEVIISDQLDLTRVDIDTLSLGPIAFGPTVVVPSPGASSFLSDVDLRPAKDLIVRVEVKLNKTSGLVTWRMTAIDPATGQLPDDPFAGFLPPNIVPPEGDGSVVFAIMARKDLATGTDVTNDAAIVFDNNAPILTPAWRNALDNSTPSSQVSALALTQPSATFEMHWSGTDSGAGIKDYTVFVSENGGPFAIWLAKTPETSAAFVGVAGSSYGFYSLARDLANNTEAKAPIAETSTTVLACATNATTQVRIQRGPFRFNRSTNRYVQTVTITNVGDVNLSGPIFLALDGLPAGSTLVAPAGMTACAPPVNSVYASISTGKGAVLKVGKATQVSLEFANPTHQTITYTPRVLAGAGER